VAHLSKKNRFMGAATAAAEAEYLAARFREYARISRNVSAAGALLALGLWLRDWVYNPLLALETLDLRLLMAFSAALYAASLAANARRGLALASGYAAVFAVEFAVLEIWTRLGAGYMASFPGYLYVYLILPLIMMPFSFRESALALAIVPLVPNLQALTGLAPGFPLLSFNAMIWPAFAIALYAYREYDRLLRRVLDSQRRLMDLATRDELTGLGNRRYFMQRGEEAVRLAARHARPLSLLMIDLDHFKAVNDRYGHAAGDDVLKFLAVTLSLHSRSTDTCGRIGGEEFAIVLPETDLGEALRSAGRIREAIARTPVPTDQSAEPIVITVSIGAATLAPGQSLEALLEQADRALYEAKRAGRDRVAGTATRQAA
jgi:diguanylate cyclase (GGDEF)-like protein